MPNDPPSTYAAAGVNVHAYEQWLESLSKKLPAIGGFAGLIPLGPAIAGMSDPQLVASTDGVGTKLLVARAAGDLSTVGIDCVAMVVNDILCCGARPLTFLDYYAVSRFCPKEADEVLAGIRRGCEMAGCDLIGGETAELPGLLQAGDFDIAGFGVGVVDKSKVVDGASIQPGDAIIGIASSGLHSNGYSLARRILPEYRTDQALAREMLTPTKIYVKSVMALIEGARVKGLAHITGEGLPGNLCRPLPPTVDAVIHPSRWPRHSIFTRLERKGVTPKEMFDTFNMGIGMCAILAREDAQKAIGIIENAGESAFLIGEIAPGTGQVVL